MHLNITSLVGAALALALFALVYTKLKGAKRSLRLIWFLVFVLLSIPALSFTVYYLHLFPDTVAYYEFRSMRGVELFVLFLGGAGGVVATFAPRLTMVLSLTGVLGLAIAPFLKPLIGPISDTSFENQFKQKVVIQSTPSTCGPSSVATIMNQLEVPVSELETARAAYSYRGGTEAWYLARFVRSKGLEAEFVFLKGFSPDISLPLVAGVGLGSVGHFIPILKKEGNDFITGDPLVGERRFTLSELLKHYQFTGFHMKVWKPQNPGS